MTEPMAGTAERRRRETAGRRAETACVWHLRLRGWRIIARRARSPVGEIDIVAARRGLVAFIEVKARRDLALAAASVTPHQRRRIARAAAAFLQKRPDLAGRDMRFDVMLVAPWRAPRHLMDAWREP